LVLENEHYTSGFQRRLNQKPMLKLWVSA